jgi:hypothetical protein
MTYHLSAAACLTLTLCGSALAQSAPPLSPATNPPLRIDADFPGGNIAVGEIAGDVVNLRTDLRDTKGSWFYWYFRVNGAQGRNLTFNFTEGDPIGVRGAAVSTDEGATWKWLGPPKDTKSFSYHFPANSGAVRFSFGMPYSQQHLDAFLGGIGTHPALRKDTLCQSRKGRAVERLHIGKLDGKPRFRVLITSRSHACEMMMSYSVEGIIQAALAGDAQGKWFRENVEMLVVPFVDKDGVEEGDQGKNRLPHDHNRDYDPNGLYPETRALQEYVPKWSEGKLRIALDLHCPHIRGETNEKIYLVGSEDPEIQKKGQRFSEILERVRKGPLVYRAADNIPFGKDWNTAANFKAGTNGARWAARLPGIDLATTFELPYANVHGSEVNAESARAFGHDLASAIREYLETSGKQ